MRPPHDEETHPARGVDGWHVEGSDDYLDEVTPDGAGDDSAAADDPAAVDDRAAADEQYFHPEPLSPRHPAGKGRPASRAALTAVPPVQDGTPDVGTGSTGDGADNEWSGAVEESDTARADRERSADPRLAPAMERMSRLLETVEPEQPADRRRGRRTEPVGDEAAEPDDDALAARAERVSMHALTRRGVSTSELRRTLTSRELPEHIVEAELSRLEGVGLLDDAELARTLVRTLTERKRLGRSALVGELKRRGLDSESITLALDDLDGDDEVTRADELARKRAPQLRSLDRVTAERRLLGFLQRKGYSGSIAQTAVRKALGESSSGVRFE